MAAAAAFKVSCASLCLMDSMCTCMHKSGDRGQSATYQQHECWAGTAASMLCTHIQFSPQSVTLENYCVCDAVVVRACRARDAGVDALRMEALAPSAKRSRTGDTAAQPAGQLEGHAAKYASVMPLTLFAAFIYMLHVCMLNCLQSLVISNAVQG